ncbi:hypothetical protein M406DRAFT_334836 [Cryphonectria parasitica EP155]|uniref:MYND-type domain-containing protein n=1 Tax=Cryphonectria parasitica (strain ATCC 38755 / EP155) TaxID=660469 RepID=A0A9P5CJX2_CRYP1|nr:uncharacterized protein M406DRAFT_334836 [Cryphonectria parasitica EP155]KAF3760160.1 hypothetical protein M406DRAFT_334836 [Cryphonectria parasitica EP155]
MANVVEQKCIKCKKIFTQVGSTVHHCRDCKAKYCSAHCKNNDWVAHENACGIEWDENGNVIQKSNSHLCHAYAPNEGGNIITYQEDENVAMRLLIEAYRITDEDDRIAKGRLSLETDKPKPQYITGHAFKGLQDFLRVLEGTRGVLPYWWSREKRKECEEIAQKMYHWSDIETDVPKEIDAPCRFGGPVMRVPLRRFVSFFAGVGPLENLL